MSIPFRKLLLPVDLTEKCVTALELAADIAIASLGEVHLLHVVELIPGLPPEEDKEFYARLEATGNAHLRSLADRLEARGCRYRTTVRLGNRVQKILEESVAGGADLVVLPSHRIDLEHPGERWGTLSYKLGILSQCPVLLVK